MKTKLNFSGRVLRRAGILSGIGLTCVVALCLAANDPLKLNISDKPLDRSKPGVSYAHVVESVTPSVVTVESTRTVQVREFRHPFLDDPVWRRFFGPDFDAEPRRSAPQRRHSLGSGVIVTEDGYILTNNHVVEDADPDGIKVAMPDGRTRYDAKIIGRDPRTDVAVLKVDAGKKLPAVTLGDSDQLKVGDVVLAIGNPFGIGQSVSSGVISALSRGFGILGQGGYEDFIQTDASINRGNSGGALVDAEGRLIGLSQSIASPSGANAGVGFAVPINLARSVMEQLVAHGKINRGYLGVNLQELTPEIAEGLKVPDASGALVGGVMPGTPAAKAGFQAGDVIVAFNGKPVNNSSQLRLMVAQTPPKTEVTFKVLRNKKERTINVTLAALPDDLAAQRSSGGFDDDDSVSGQSALAGVDISDLDRATRQRYGIPSRIKGAVVTGVEDGSAAAEAGLRVGDVIVEIQQKPVESAADVLDILDGFEGKRVLLRVYSQMGGMGSTRFLSVPVRK